MNRELLLIPLRTAIILGLLLTGLGQLTSSWRETLRAPVSGAVGASTFGLERPRGRGLGASGSVSHQELTKGSLALSPDQRDKLTFEELMAVEYLGDGPVDNRYFVPVGESAPALHAFEGTLEVPWTEMGNTASQAAHKGNEGLRWFPPFSTRFFTHEDYLVPAERDVLCPGEPHYWCVILSPGKVWSEPGDKGMSRASFPFVLVNEWSNNTHNGLATFLYDDAQVSSLRFQITQETSGDRPYQFDAWGQTPVAYTPRATGDQDDRLEGRPDATRFAEELARQVPIHPWAELAEKYDPQQLGAFSRSIPPQAVSAAGVVIDGVLYLQPPMTRYGAYPYPRAMRHGVYSVTKSMGAAVAMLRLAQKYGAEVFDLRIADYVEVAAGHDGWNRVTFGDALSMATGVGETRPEPGVSNFAQDESQPRFREFIEARSAQDKLAVCFSYPNYPWGPGQVTRYNSINTFVLSAAMTGFLRSKEGPDAHLWDMVSEEVYKPIGMLHLPTMHTVEPDGSQGIPLLFMGLYPTVDDVAKITSLLQNGGQYEGAQLLHAAKLEEALYRRGLVGLPTGYRFEAGDYAYHLSFHSVAYRTEDGHYFQVPFMAGLGGNTVVLAPNGISGFVLTDAYVAEPYLMTQVIEGLRPFPGDGIDLDRLILVPQSIRVLPKARQTYLILDRTLLAWFILTAAALVLFLYDQVRGTPTAWPMRLIWLVVVLFTGPLGLLAYWLAHRQPARAPDSQAVLTNGRRALGATAYSAAGYGVAMVLVQVVVNSLPVLPAGPAIALAVIYALPLLIGLLVFRAPLLASLVEGGYRAAVQRTLLSEIVAVNLALTGAIPALLIPVNRHPLVFGTANLPTWGLFSMATIAGAIVLHPFNLWMARRGITVWPVRVVVGAAAGRGQESVVTPSLRDAWWVLLLSIALLIASLGLTMLSLF